VSDICSTLLGSQSHPQRRSCHQSCSRSSTSNPGSRPQLCRNVSSEGPGIIVITGVLERNIASRKSSGKGVEPAGDTKLSSSATAKSGEVRSAVTEVTLLYHKPAEHKGIPYHSCSPTNASHCARLSRCGDCQAFSGALMAGYCESRCNCASVSQLRRTNVVRVYVVLADAVTCAES
jgi:hypothetical protein